MKRTGSSIKGPGLIVGLKQRVHFATQFVVADPTQKLRSFDCRNFNDLLEERLDSLPLLGGHAAYFPKAASHLAISAAISRAQFSFWPRSPSRRRASSMMLWLWRNLSLAAIINFLLASADARGDAASAT